MLLPKHGPWYLAGSSHPQALALVDGSGEFAGHGPHYSRRTPGSRTFTGVGKEVVLLHETGRAVWAVVLARTPAPRGGKASSAQRFLWRNNVFRNLGAGLSSELIRSAVDATRHFWAAKYGELPELRMRTEIGIKSVKSSNPGYCYLMAGWSKGRTVRGKLYLHEPEPE